MIWTYEGGQLRTRGGTKCLVTSHGTESSHTPSLVNFALTMRDCASVIPSPTISQDITWDYVNGQWKSHGGTKCLVTWHGTESSHTSSLIHYGLTMRDCPDLVCDLNELMRISCTCTLFSQVLFSAPGSTHQSAYWASDIQGVHTESLPQ